MNDIISFEEFFEKELILGGLAQGRTLQDIADHHKVHLKEIKKELEKGIEVELEHTPDRKVSEEIAKDHLWENPRYYTLLATIENKNERMNNIITFEDFVNESVNEVKDQTEITSKDAMRISDIIRKAGGDWNEKAKALTRQMANAITDLSKIIRRARAAEDENWHEMASIFFSRAIELK